MTAHYLLDDILIIVIDLLLNRVQKFGYSHCSVYSTFIFKDINLSLHLREHAIELLIRLIDLRLLLQKCAIFGAKDTGFQPAVSNGLRSNATCFIANPSKIWGYS